MTTAEAYIAVAVGAARDIQEPHIVEEALDRLPVAAYVTDAQGTVIHFNRACIHIAGRVPVARQDRWCVTWKLYTPDGLPLPHDQCPMAVAVRERRVVRGHRAIAERPDGSRVKFAPYPTPLFDDSGAFIGAVNLLLEVADQGRAAQLHAQAARCRRLAGAIMDYQTIGSLNALAVEYETQAAHLAPAD